MLVGAHGSRTLIAGSLAKLRRDRATSVSSLTSFAQAITAVVTSVPANSHERGDGLRLLVLPIGSDADDETFHLRIIRWFRGAGADGANVAEWLPVVSEYSITLGGPVGVASGTLLASADERFAKEIESVVSPTAEDQIYSPDTADHAAYIHVDALGCERVSFDYGGNETAASANCLFAWI